MRRQGRLEREAKGSIPASVLSGAWTPPGTYSGDLNALLNSITSWGEANTTASPDDIILYGLPSSVISQPPQLVSDVNALDDAGNWTYSVNKDGPGTAHWGAFKASVKAVTADCKL
jgi:hypothetical protein